jgi:hypothetical protein
VVKKFRDSKFHKYLAKFRDTYEILRNLYELFTRSANFRYHPTNKPAIDQLSFAYRMPYLSFFSINCQNTTIKHQIQLWILWLKSFSLTVGKLAYVKNHFKRSLLSLINSFLLKGFLKSITIISYERC